MEQSLAILLGTIIGALISFLSTLFLLRQKSKLFEVQLNNTNELMQKQFRDSDAKLLRTIQDENERLLKQLKHERNIKIMEMKIEAYSVVMARIHAIDLKDYSAILEELAISIARVLLLASNDLLLALGIQQGVKNLNEWLSTEHDVREIVDLFSSLNVARAMREEFQKEEFSTLPTEGIAPTTNEKKVINE